MNWSGRWNRLDIDSNGRTSSGSKALQETTIEDNGKRITVVAGPKVVAGKSFRLLELVFRPPYGLSNQKATMR